MKSLVASLSALLTLSACSAAPTTDSGPPAWFCLVADDADRLTEGYRRLITAYTPADANKYLASSFVEFSDSINTLAGIPLGEPTFRSKQDFMAAQASQPPFDIKIDGVAGVGCRNIVLLWSGSFGAAKQRVRGVTNLIAWRADKDQPWKIARIDMEMNSLMWLVDMGGNFTLPKRNA